MKMTVSPILPRILFLAMIAISMVGCVKPAIPEPPSTADETTKVNSRGPDAAPMTQAARFAKSRSTILGMQAYELNGNRHSGSASLMTANGIEELETVDFKILFKQMMGLAMESAAEEVVKFHAQRHPKAKRGMVVEISFEERYGSKEGPAAALPCALLVESIITGIEYDPEFAITGAMDVNGLVKAVGSMDRKVRGAIERGCKILAIPAENEAAVPNLIIQSGLQTIFQVQIFSVDRFETALSLAAGGENRPDDLKKAIAEFSQVQEVLGKPNGMSMLSNPFVIAKLQSVAELAPNHLSAKYLLLKSQGKEPNVLTLVGSLQYIDIQAEPLIQAIREEKIASKASNLEADLFKKAQLTLSRARSQLDPRTRACADAIVDLAEIAAYFVENPPRTSAKRKGDLADIFAAFKQIEQEYENLERLLDEHEKSMR